MADTTASDQLPARAKRSNRAAWLRRQVLDWHRRLGIVSSVVVIVLCLTGLALNRTVELALDERMINLRPLNVWYGLAPTSSPISFKADKLWVTVLDNTLFIGSNAAGSIAGTVTGVIAWEDGALVAQANELTLYSAEGQLFDQRNADQLPGQLLGLGKTPTNLIAIKTDKGLFATNADMEKWQPIAQTILWSSQGTAPQTLTNAVIAAHSGRGLSINRIILDIHSGRIFGKWGPYVMDAAAIILLLLTATGLYNWSKRPKRNRTTRSRR